MRCDLNGDVLLVVIRRYRFMMVIVQRC